MLDNIIIGFAVGTWSFLWCGPLTSPDMAGNIVPSLYWQMMGEYTVWKEWLSKPLFGCAVCHSFWLGLLIVLFILEPLFSVNNFVMIVAALFSAYYLSKKYEQQ